MNGLAITVPLRGMQHSCQPVDAETDRYQWFSTIPPERIGLHGEFDYYGLSKRVYRCLSANVADTLRRLKVRQRGRVVVLSGQVSSPYLLHKIVKLILSVDGVDEVETRGVAVADAC